MRPFALGLLMIACAGNDSTASLPFDLTIARAVADETSHFQVLIARNGSAVDCNAVQATCAVTVVPESTLVPVRSRTGATTRAALIPVDDAFETAKSQDVTLAGIDVDDGTRDFLVVIEALRADAKLLASSCNYVEEIRAGDDNPKLMTVPLKAITPIPTCNPKVPD